MSRFLAPLILVAVMILVFVIGLNRDPSEIPSPLLLKPAPEFELPRLKDPSRTVGSADYEGRFALVNVWATWCVACRQEHDFLLQLAREIRRMMEEGKTDAEVYDFLVTRYGDFVLYRPRMSGKTMVLWIAPFLLIAVGAIIAVNVVRGRMTMPIDDNSASDQVDG